MADHKGIYYFWIACFTVLLLLAMVTIAIIGLATASYLALYVPSPPFIVKQTWTAEILYEVGKMSGEDEREKALQMECEADGFPPPNYRWTKNGQEFILQDHRDRISQTPGRGTLIFASLRDEDAGEYQCYALNIYGTAISRSVQVRKKGSDFPPAAMNQSNLLGEGKGVETV